MATANDTRVDTTFIGYLLIGFMLLIIGVIGLMGAGVFGHVYKDMPLDYAVFGQICGIIGLILILLTIFAYRTGKQASAGIFVFFALFMFAEYVDIKVKFSAEYANSDWFMFMAIAIFFLIFAIYALVDRAPKFVSVLLVILGLMTVFISICNLNGSWATYNEDIYKALSIVYLIFAFLGFIVATYLGLAYANPKKIPLI